MVPLSLLGEVEAPLQGLWEEQGRGSNSLVYCALETKAHWAPLLASGTARGPEGPWGQSGGLLMARKDHEKTTRLTPRKEGNQNPGCTLLEGFPRMAMASSAKTRLDQETN